MEDSIDAMTRDQLACELKHTLVTYGEWERVQKAVREARAAGSIEELRAGYRNVLEVVQNLDA